jgi:hypothetical protein
MEDMAAFTPYYTVVSDRYIRCMHWKLTEWTVIAWDLARRTTTFVGYATYATNVTFAISLVVIRVPCVPSPLGNSMP